MISYFEELDQFLGEEFSDDYWSDYALTVAIEITRRLPIPDLIKLNQVWEMRHQSWQERCAQIVTYATNVKYALEVLIGMIKKADQKIAILALDSLRTSDFLNNLSANQREVVLTMSKKYLSLTHSKLEKQVIESLIVLLQNNNSVI